MTIYPRESKENILVFPNPFNDTFSLELGEEDCTLEVYDIYGSRVISTKMNTKSKEIASSKNLSSGTYIYRVLKNGEQIKEGKVIKI